MAGSTAGLQSLHGKVAVVTGGSRGIGRAVARRLAADGAAVVLSYVQNEAAARAAVAEVEAAGGTAAAVRADTGRVEDVRALVAGAAGRFGRLDVLVNNAALTDRRPVEQLTEAEYARTFDVNVRGPLFAMQEAARRLGPGGRIVNVSSGATVLSTPGSALYAASKAALEQVTRVLAKELGPRGITVNAVSPGPTETDALSPEFAARAAGMTPLGRVGRPEDVADVVAFLAGEGGRWITGQNLQAGGGIVMA